MTDDTWARALNPQRVSERVRAAVRPLRGPRTGALKRAVRRRTHRALPRTGALTPQARPNNPTRALFHSRSLRIAETLRATRVNAFAREYLEILSDDVVVTIATGPARAARARALSRASSSGSAGAARICRDLQAATPVLVSGCAGGSQRIRNPGVGRRATSSSVLHRFSGRTCRTDSSSGCPCPGCRRGHGLRSWTESAPAGRARAGSSDPGRPRARPLPASPVIEDSE